MIEFVRWRINLWLAGVGERVYQTIRRTESRRFGTGWDRGPFSRFVDKVAPWVGSGAIGYERVTLRRWLWRLRYPRRFLWLGLLGFTRRTIARLLPFSAGPGRYEGMDAATAMQAEWLDSNSELAADGCGDLSIYPLWTSVFIGLDVPWSRQREHWTLERDEMGFVSVQQYDSSLAASIAFAGAEYRFGLATRWSDDFDDEEPPDINREGLPEFNGAFE